MSCMESMDRGCHSHWSYLSLRCNNNNNNNIIVLYYRLAEHIDRYMAVVQYIVITLHTRVQLLSSQ